MTQQNNQYTDDQIVAARHKLWRMGELKWKLSPTQVRMYDFWYSTHDKGKTSVFNCGRRIGKTHFLTIIALEQCIKHPKSVVKFLQPEKNQVKRNVTPIMDRILQDCPNDMRPAYKTQESAFVFPNGSVIQFAGSDGGNHEKLRGDDAHLCLIDEAGFLKAPLGYIIRSIFAPSTMRTKGKIILSSSTPLDASHEFIRYMETARVQKRFFTATTKECLIEHEDAGNTLFTRDMYEALVEEYPGGETDEEFRRECLNEIITDGTNSIVPEFTEELMEEIVREWKMPIFCDRYVSMDIGHRDLTVVLFGFYDFEHDTVVIQDEIVMNGPQMTTDSLAQAIYSKESELWYDEVVQELNEPSLRISDNNLILINDLMKLHGLSFMATDKDNKEAQINQLRVELQNFRICINPKCETLITHLKFGKWENSNRGTSRKFGRSPDHGHYDAIDALIYMIRNIPRGKNPFPPGYRLGFLGRSSDLFVKNPHNEEDNTDINQAFADMFKVKRRR